MDRTTIDFGIDLGTTNSAIATVRGVGTEIIKNNDDMDITPSAVGFDRRGAVLVGATAKAKDSDSYVEFKRRMGTDHLYQFKAAGFAKRPEELSAEVLKELRGNVQQRLGEAINAAVITVPAAFELHQCDATRKAAQLAGLLESPLLQEPVAAALAYGFQADTQKAFWLVYDFGGGTFDAALIRSEEGTIRVVNHGGDNFLGGSDIDWEIVNRVLVPRILREHKLDGFERTNERWKVAFAKLKRSAERAKINLSRTESTSLRECEFEDGNGGMIEVDFDITRADVQRVAAPFVQRSVEICRRVLKERSLGKSAVEKVILVGGPTLAPYFREALGEELGIAIDHSVDPLTVVARGAGVFAGTQRLAPRAGSVSKEVFALDLKYNPVGLDTNPLVGGKVVPPKGVTLSGFTIELVDQKTRWRSGKIPVGNDGVFTTTLRAEPGERNVYAIDLRDVAGSAKKTSPESLTYTIGAAVGEQVLMHAIGVALANNDYDRVFEKGQGLPAKATRKYQAAFLLRKGQSGDALRIPVVEGEAARGDRNKLVGRLDISAEQITRDLAVGSEIEVTIRIDKSRIVTVQAYVPALDADFEGTYQRGTVTREPADIKVDLKSEIARMGELKEKAATTGDQEAGKLLSEVESGQLLSEVRQLAAGARDGDTAAKCESRLLELKSRLDRVDDKLQWPTLAAEAEDFIGRLSAALQQDGTSEQKKEGEIIIAEMRTILKTRNPDDLKRKQAQGESLYWRIASEQPKFWVGCFQYLEKDIERMADQERAARLFEQGRAYISHNNATGLQNVVRELWKMMPEERVQEAKERGYQGGLRKAG